MSDTDDLLDDIFDGQRPPFYAEFAGWVRGSRRYRAFAAAYRTKIRAKLKNARHEGSIEDLAAELETAALLLREERFTLEYELYAANKQRGPDFTVTFKTHTPFNVEVRRMRGESVVGGDAETRIARLAGALVDKVGQMPPGMPNLLWLIPEGGLSADDVAAAAAALRRLADRKDEAYFTRRGFESAADYVRRYSRLSGVVLRLPGECVVWLNPAARHPAPPEIVAAVQQLVRP